MEFLKTVFGDKALTYADFAAAVAAGHTEALALLNVTVGPARGGGRPPRR